MFVKRLIIFVAAVAASGIVLGAEGSGLQVKTTRTGAQATVEWEYAEGQALVSVEDAKHAPVLGLTRADFTVGRADAAGKVISVEPIARSTEVPRHVVMVLDNSFSMVERKAVPKLLEGVGAVLKTARPIDDFRIVVFHDGKPVNMGGRDLHVQVFQSHERSELETFVTNAYKKGNITDNTYLYEGVYAGVELLRGIPINELRFLTIFSDGEDLNSKFKADVVNQAAQSVPAFRVYAIDYMPGQRIDSFLAGFASQNHGQARKAGTGADLLSAFQQFAEKLDHYYVVTYAFGGSPKRVLFPEAALFDFDKSDLKPAGKERLKAYREEAKAQMSKADKVKIIGYTDNAGDAEYNKKLSMRRAEAIRDYLVSIGVDQTKLEVGGEGMSNPISDNLTPEGRAKNRRVEIEVIGLGN